METKNLLHSNTVVLVTGGAKGITAQCAINLAKTAQCKFILVGRTPAATSEPEWAASVVAAEDLQKKAIFYYASKAEKRSPKEIQREVAAVLSNREIAATLEAIRVSGGQALYRSADVTNAAEFAGQVGSAVQELGQITGVIHGAGNLADKLIENKSGQDFDLVVNTKVKGLHSVLQAVDPQKLEFLVLFSSVAGFFGNAGQTDYAIANEILNKSAHILRKALPDCRVIAIDWGPWDSGMVSPQLKKVFEQRNIPLIHTVAGVQTLVDELTGAQRATPQVLAGSPIFGQHEISINKESPIVIHRRITLEDNPFANHHRIGQNAVLPATCASTWILDACEASFPGWHLHRMEDFKVLKGITFEEGEQEFEVKLEPQRETETRKKHIDVIVTSQNKGQRKIFRYSAKAELVQKIPSPPKHEVVKDLNQIGAQHRSGQEFYQDGTLFHGPAFQGIQEVTRLDEHMVVTRVSLPALSDADQGQFPVRSANAFFNDAVVQSLLIWTQEYQHAPCLPSRLHEWVQYRVVPFDMPVWAILTVTFHNGHAVSGDILVVDDAGYEFFHYTGLEGTISSQLGRLIGKKAG